MLHGGVIASLLDGAMTNCMFAYGTPAITAELAVRFRHPVIVNRPAKVRAWVERSSPPLHVLKAVVLQDERPKATAVGKFMEQAGLAGGTYKVPGNESPAGA
jgi:acyl-coenzyme A thioesterase PaaI-like protein